MDSKGKWAQWTWSDTGPGRFHAIVAIADGEAVAPDGTRTPVKAAVLACGRVRLAPETTVDAPPEGADVHETCKNLDGLRLLVRERSGRSIPTPVEPVLA